MTGEYLYSASDHIPNNCTLCKHFSSYADVYEDELEPADQGYCFLLPTAEHVDCTVTCDKFTPTQTQQ